MARKIYKKKKRSFKRSFKRYTKKTGYKNFKKNISKFAEKKFIDYEVEELDMIGGNFHSA